MRWILKGGIQKKILQNPESESESWMLKLECPEFWGTAGDKNCHVNQISTVYCRILANKKRSTCSDWSSNLQ